MLFKTSIGTGAQLLNYSNFGTSNFWIRGKAVDAQGTARFQDVAVTVNTSGATCVV